MGIDNDLLPIAQKMAEALRQYAHPKMIVPHGVAAIALGEWEAYLKPKSMMEKAVEENEVIQAIKRQQYD